MRLVVRKNDLGRAAELVRLESAQVVEDISQDILTDVRAGVDGKTLTKTVAISRKNAGRTATIGVGDLRRGFWAGWDEYGRQGHPATPVVTPAAESRRPEFMARMRSILRRL